MPNTKSAIRRTKKTKLQTSVNRIRKSKYKSAVKKMSAYINNWQNKRSQDFLPKFHSQLMKVAKLVLSIKKLCQEKFQELTKKISKSKKNK